jgi:hypothetical protein
LKTIISIETALNHIDYQLGIGEHVCNSKYPIGTCSQCDLQEIRDLLVELNSQSGWTSRLTESPEGPVGSRDIEAEVQKLIDHFNAFRRWMRAAGERAELELPHDGTFVGVDKRSIHISVGKVLK